MPYFLNNVLVSIAGFSRVVKKMLSRGVSARGGQICIQIAYEWGGYDSAFNQAILLSLYHSNNYPYFPGGKVELIIENQVTNYTKNALINSQSVSYKTVDD